MFKLLSIAEIGNYVATNFGTVAVVASTVAISSTAAFKMVETVSDPVAESNSRISSNQNSNQNSDPNIQITIDPTSADLALSSGSSCIITISGQRYDVSSLRRTHSGGDVFNCNTDMTGSYMGQHGSDLTRMLSYKINNDGSVGVAQQIPAATFDATSVALHNKPGDCYVAFNGRVYDVSSHSSWRSCVHHGIAGGQDITTRFPHNLSYLSTLPIVGSYSGGAAYNPGSVSGDDEYEDEDEDEDEEEDRDEDEDEEEDRDEDEDDDRKDERDDDRDDEREDEDD